MSCRCDQRRQLAKGLTETRALASKDGILEGSSGVVRGEASRADAEYAGRGAVIVVFADDNDNLRCVIPPETRVADHAARRGLAGLGDHVDASMHIAAGSQQALGFHVTSKCGRKDINAGARWDDTDMPYTHVYLLAITLLAAGSDR